MKYLKCLLVTVAAVMLSGCAVPYTGRTMNLGTSPSRAAKTDISAAISNKRAAVANDPNNADAFAQLSYLLNKNKQYDEAVTAAKRAIQLNPSSDVAFHNLGSAYQEKRRYDDALKAYRKAIAIVPAAVTYFKLGTLYTDKQDYTAAARAFAKASKLDAKNDTWQVYLAVARYRAGKYDDALSAIDKAVALKNQGAIGMKIRIEGQTDGFTTQTWLTVIGTEAGGPADKAGIKAGDMITAIDKMDTLDLQKIKKYIEGKAPGDTVDVYLPGFFLPSWKTIVLARLKDPGLPLKLGVKSGILAKLGRVAEAARYARKALASKRAGAASNSWAKVALGRIAIGDGRYDEAIKLLSDVKAGATAKILEAAAYAGKGDTGKAVEIFSAIPEGKISPNNVPLRNDRAGLMRALAPVAEAHREKARQLGAQDRFREAMKEYAGAIALAADDKEEKTVRGEMFRMVRAMPGLPKLSDDAHKYAVRGELLVKEGRFKKAVAEFKKASRLAPYSAKLYLNTALVCEKTKDYAEAIRNMKVYLQAAPDSPNIQAARDKTIQWELLLEQAGEENAR